MVHISILVPEGENNLSSIVGAYKILSRANSYWKENYQKDKYKIELVGISDEVDFHNGLFSVKPQKRITEISRTGLIIIPSLNHHYKQAIKGNKPLISWIERQYKNGAEVASICTGAFLLASTGLLDGRTCSTHWAFEDILKNLFPKIIVQPEKLITDENGIYTNGGAYSFLNLIIYLIEKYFDRQTAVFCSKVFQIEIDRHSQTAFIIFKGQKNHNDELVLNAQIHIENNIQEKVRVEALSAKYAISRRNFDRRFIKATGNTPLQYAQRVKIEAAKKSLETTRKTIHEVMYEVGYSDLKAFRDVFKKNSGMSPLEYKNKYNKDAQTSVGIVKGRSAG
jgi:transcriptional regulator GlxA family with amidase domain